LEFLPKNPSTEVGYEHQGRGSGAGSQHLGLACGKVLGQCHLHWSRTRSSVQIPEGVIGFSIGQGKMQTSIILHNKSQILMLRQTFPFWQYEANGT